MRDFSPARPGLTMRPSDLTPIHDYPRFRPELAPAPFLPMSRADMNALGWDSCDIVLVTGDAYIDHPSFGMALIGRLLEAQGFRVGILAQPDYTSAEAFRTLGRPNLFFGVTAGNMDSMINRYTAERKPRSDDAYTPGGQSGARPDRATVIYSQRCREAFPGSQVMVGGIEASLRRIAQYDYWSETVRQSALVYTKADLLLFGNAERALIEIAHRAGRGERLRDMRDIRGTAFIVPSGWRPEADWHELDSTELDLPGRIEPLPDPYAEESTGQAAQAASNVQPVRIVPAAQRVAARKAERARTVVRLPAYEAVSQDPVLYAHASRLLHLESNPGNARALVQAHGSRDVWINPPPVPLTTPEMDYVFGLPYARNPHPGYGKARIPAWDMIKFSVNIMRGCFGGCTFCSITEHEGRIIQSRSEQSILSEIEEIRDKTRGFKGHITDLGGPTANMYRLACKDPAIESSCRRLSCVYPDICENMGTDHGPLVQLYRKARSLPGVKLVTIGSGLRYDLAVRSPEYIRELVTHHVSGLLKIAPEHTETAPLSKMMKPGVDTYYRFKKLFDRYSQEAGKKQYLIPYFIAAHPGTADEDMLNLALWCKQNGFRPDQVQAFTPTPMALATTMWHTGRNPLRKVTRNSDSAVDPVREAWRRKLHKALLRYHDPDNWPLLRDALRQMGRAELIGNGPQHLVPPGPGVRAAAQQGQGRNPRPEKAFHHAPPPVGKAAGSRKPAARTPATARPKEAPAGQGGRSQPATRARNKRG